MSNKFDYTRTARNIALKYPTFNHLATQVNFWVIAFVVLAMILLINMEAIIISYGVGTEVDLLPSILMAVFAGVFFGIALGLADSLIEKKLSKCMSMGIIIIIHFVIYYLILISLMLILKFGIWDYIIVPYYFDGVSPFNDKIMWKSYYKVMLLYTFMMSIVISFINQMNKKFGPGILIPMLLGKYRKPKEEQRIFMFMDLRSSTTLAEKLGHLKYSALIRDSFTDINNVLAKHQAEIYQYVGDEIVVSWPLGNIEEKISCVEFFFSCQEQFNSRSEYYLNNYGSVPRFKAGLHQGFVTAVEVGEIKREIAYHGDAINTASRIQDKCNEYKTDFLISESISNELNWKEKFSKKFVGTVSLRGKVNPVNIYSVSLV